MAMEWTDELIARLKELWEQGLSTAEIGRQLSITKNAVVGKAHRLGLPPRPSPIRNKAAAEGAASGKPARSRTSRTRKAEEAPAEDGVKAEPPAAAGQKAAAPSAEKKAAGTARAKAAVEKVEKPARAKAAGTAAKTGGAVKDAPSRKAADDVDMDDEADLVSARRPAAPASQRKVAPPRRVRDTLDRPSRQGPTCQWPIGDPGTPDFHFCGASPLSGKPYCAEHAAIAYVKIRDRRH